MEKYYYKNEELNLRKKLRNMKLIATSLLVFMTAVFIIFKRYEDRGLLFSSITAFAEASMVGALADWFAVVAIFHHPLGLRIIPHTAIIQNNKKRIARALSNFVVSNFFTPELIKAKLNKVSVSSKISAYIISNREKLAGGAASKLPAVLDAIVDDKQLEDYLKAFANRKVAEIKLYPALAGIIVPVTEGGYHKPLVRALISVTYKYIGDNKEKTLLVLAGINKTLAMPIIGDLIYKKILDYLLMQIEALDNNEDAQINRLILSALPKLLEDMRNDEELIEKGEQLKLQLVESEAFNGVIMKLSEAILELKNSFLKDEERLRNKVGTILDMVVYGINRNQNFRENIDTAVIEIAEGLVVLYGDKVGSLIYDTMDGWETGDMVDKLEVQVGADLQYIRINGTVIGGLAGLAIHLLSQLF
ncbi:MAG: putative rane protein [Eubacterium sp.]|jgi:uncharacterized membrane-anchored protein YjiN (DUF445 family)|nr:putative rane protein [Eubacterium sp.]